MLHWLSLYNQSETCSLSVRNKSHCFAYALIAPYFFPSQTPFICHWQRSSAQQIRCTRSCATQALLNFEFVRCCTGCRFIFSPRPAHCRSEISHTASLTLSLLHISSLRRLPSSATGSGHLLSKFAARGTVLHNVIFHNCHKYGIAKFAYC